MDKRWVEYGYHVGAYYNTPVEVIMEYRIIIEQNEDGIFIAQCPSLPGFVSQGKTRQESIENIKNAIKGYQESLKKRGEPTPPLIQFSKY